MDQWYVELFKDYGLKYDQESFSQGTSGECDFIENEIRHNKKLRIIDIGCGTGRHSLELARRGYTITGIDLSESLLERARAKASAENLKVDFQKRDARYLRFVKKFDLAIMLCEGAFPLMETDEMNFLILQNAARVLKPGGKLIFTTLNGLFPLSHSIDEFLASATQEGNAEYHGNSFDLMTFRASSITTVVDDLGNKKELECNERYYMPTEIHWLLTSLGFASVSIFGARLGAFSREDRLTTQDYEMLVVAQKSAYTTARNA